MISQEVLEKLARQYQTGVFPNIAREYFQHVFLSELYKLPAAEKLLFKGGTALRIIYGSPRFSADLDFSAFGIVPRKIERFAEDLFIKTLAEVARIGAKIEIGKKSGATTGGYFGIAEFSLHDYPPIGIEVNVSSRNGKRIDGEIDSVINDFVPAYNLFHLPQAELVEEKIFGALLARRKPRDFYDLYFMMRKNMLVAEQKRKLAEIKDKIINWARKIDFRGELGVFLPADQQAIVRDFPRALESELARQLA